MKKLFVLSVACSLIGGCSVAGPFVTNISYDGDKTLTIEKCMVQMNGFTGTVSNKDCSTTQIRINSLNQNKPNGAQAKNSSETIGE